MNCHCGTSLTGKQTKFCSIPCKTVDTNSRNQNYAKQQERGLKRKQDLVILRGGGCEECGYAENLAALCFHHVDESAKSFELNLRSLSNNHLEVILTEFEKCMILCHNCHMEHHYPNLSGWWVDRATGSVTAGDQKVHILG